MFASLIQRLRKPAFPLPQPMSQPAVNDQRVAFTVQAEGAPPVQILFPASTRQHRVEPEAVVFTLIYREFNKAMQYIVLHGALRKEFGCQRIPLMTASTEGLRDDEVLANAIEHAKDALWAMRNPVTCPERHDPEWRETVDLSPAPAPVKVSLGALLADPAVKPSPKEALKANAAPPVLTIEGEFMSAGMTPYVNPTTKQVGKPSFAVMVKVGDHTSAYHGSDLQRALRAAGVLPGDRVRLTKYPKQSVQVGARTVPMNIWDCTVIDRA